MQLALTCLGALSSADMAADWVRDGRVLDPGVTPGQGRLVEEGEGWEGFGPWGYTEGGKVS